jgi:segregation and condensation protein A
VIVERLRRSGALTFRALCGDADRLTTVARFLALLDLFRRGAVAFEQLTPLGELTLRWSGTSEGDIEVTDEFDTVPADQQPSGHQTADEQGGSR